MTTFIENATRKKQEQKLQIRQIMDEQWKKHTGDFSAGSSFGAILIGAKNYIADVETLTTFFFLQRLETRSIGLRSVSHQSSVF